MLLLIDFSRLTACRIGVSQVSDQMPLWDGQWPELHNIMPHECCTTNASLSCVECPGECCDPAKTGSWVGLASTHNYKNYFGERVRPGVDCPCPFVLARC